METKEHYQRMDLIKNIDNALLLMSDVNDIAIPTCPDTAVDLLRSSIEDLRKAKAILLKNPPK